MPYSKNHNLFSNTIKCFKLLILEDKNLKFVKKFKKKNKKLI